MQGEWLVGDRLELYGRAHGIDLFHAAGLLRQAGVDPGLRLALQIANVGNLLLRGLISRIDLGRMQKLRQGPLLVACLQHLAALGEVRGRSPEAHAGEGGAEAQVLGSLGVGLLVAVKGGVVVLARFGCLAKFVERVGGLSVKARAAQA